MFFVVCCFIFFQNHFFEKFFKECQQSGKQFLIQIRPDVLSENVWTDLGPDCLQRLSADGTSIQYYIAAFSKTGLYLGTNVLFVYPLYTEWNFPLLLIGPVHFCFKGCWMVFLSLEHYVSKQWRP